jgi:2-polyprenyl-6-methoxyphenol hydroxylase-like FAD-dependent oxidoreductase
MNVAAESKRIPVLIIGAGPTGLALALWLEKLGVAFRLIDKSAGPGETSRAIAVQARTLEFYDQLGLTQEFLRDGIIVREIVMRRRGKIVASAPFGDSGKDLSPYPYLYFISQEEHEKFLISKLKTKIERETELVRFIPGEKGVLATLKTPHGYEEIFADYVCGCDGAHSTVRHHLGVDFHGGTYSQVFYVADVIAKGEMAEKGVQFSLGWDDFTIVMPVGNKSTRLIGLIPSDKEKNQTFTFNDVAQPIKKNTGLQIEKVNWFSPYHVHHRVATRFQVGRIFLAGDAAHIHSPAGAQGMNTGIGDAVNLAWKLAAVIQKRAGPEILNSYSKERMAFARVLVSTTDKAFKLIASRNILGSLWRLYLLPKFFASVLGRPKTFRFAFKMISQIRIRYRKSPISQGHGGRVLAGDRLPWVGLNYEPLKSMDWQIHIYGKTDYNFREMVQRTGISIYEFSWNDEADRAGLQMDAVYLIRPDGHVGFAEPTQNVAGLRRYLDKYKIKPLSSGPKAESRPHTQTPFPLGQS